MDRETPVIVSTTAESDEVLGQIAYALLEKRIAACCQISGPIRSVYRWDGKVQSSTEHSCSIKTIAKHVPSVTEAIQKLHPYDEPEIVVTPIVGGSESYLKWIADSVE
jgi:periplasmic divalent cation tolerance protein